MQFSDVDGGGVIGRRRRRRHSEIMEIKTAGGDDPCPNTNRATTNKHLQRRGSGEPKFIPTPGGSHAQKVISHMRNDKREYPMKAQTTIKTNDNETLQHNNIS